MTFQLKSKSENQHSGKKYFKLGPEQTPFEPFRSLRMKIIFSLLLILLSIILNALKLQSFLSIVSIRIVCTPLFVIGLIWNTYDALSLLLHAIYTFFSLFSKMVLKK